MKAARTYVFVLVPILFQRVAHTRVPIGSNGSSPPDQKYEETPRWRVRDRNDREAEALPDHLFWTWFVDNPPPRSKSL